MAAVCHPGKSREGRIISRGTGTDKNPQAKIRGRAGRRRRLPVAVARPVETGGAPRYRAGVNVDAPLSGVSFDHWRNSLFNLLADHLAGGPWLPLPALREERVPSAPPDFINTSPVPNLPHCTDRRHSSRITMRYETAGLLQRTIGTMGTMPNRPAVPVTFAH